MNESFEKKLRDLSQKEYRKELAKRLRDAARVAVREDDCERFLYMARLAEEGEPVQNVGQTMAYIDYAYGRAIENMNRRPESEGGEWSTDTAWHHAQMKALDACDDMALRLPANFKHMTLQKIRGYRKSVEDMSGSPRFGTCHQAYGRLIFELLGELKELTNR